jgi:hypothetical protein
MRRFQELKNWKRPNSKGGRTIYLNNFNRQNSDFERSILDYTEIS